MLRKLMKHEFRATGRVMLPLYLVVLVTSVGANLSIRRLMNTDVPLMNVLASLLITAFAMAILAVCAMAVILMIRRFYMNLLRDEGYVMMTLPVSIHQQIWSKLLVSLVWFIATGVVVLLAVNAAAYDVHAMQELWGWVQEIFAYLTRDLPAFFHSTAFLVEFLAIGALTSFVTCLHFYAALAIGHSASGHKMALSVAAFFAIQWIGQLVSGLFFFSPLVDRIGDLAYSLMENGSAHLLLLGVIGGLAAVGAVLYAVTIYFLSRRLNLE